MSLPSAWWRPELFFEPRGWYRVAAIAGILALLGFTTTLVYFTGGTALAYPYFALVPIILAAALFGMTGGLAAGALAGLLLGPYMPLDVVAGVSQASANWLIRFGIYVALGGFTGWLFSRLHAYLRHMRSQAYTSMATGLPNRQALEEALGGVTQAKVAPRRSFLVAVELTNLRQAATRLGFAIEAMLLSSVAERLSAAVDTPGSRVYHIGADQFGVLLDDVSRRTCLRTTRRLVDALERPIDVDGLPVYLDAHFGVAAYPAHDDGNDGHLLSKALVAMHEAASGGRSYRSYDRRLDDKGRESLSLLGQLPDAMDGNQLELHYQPKFDLATGRMQGIEALLRWHHPELGMIPPGYFIPQAEQTGLIHPLTEWVLETALRQLKAFHCFQPDLQVSVNVSARNFLEHGFADRVLAACARAGIVHGLLELELTESAIMADPDEVSRQLGRLAGSGVQIAVDDFGTGHSSMMYLKRMPVSALKIDRMFVDDLCTDAPAARIVEASVALAAALGMVSIAEGVENRDTLTRLHALGCRVAQGYFLARPMPADQLEAWLSQGRRVAALDELIEGDSGSQRHDAGA